jgi:hypothetical protein
MKVLVCMSNISDTATKIAFTDNNAQFNTNGVQFILNPYKEIGLSHPIELTDGRKTNIAVNSNLYIAIEISGAMQHIAGISASTTKFANYGIVSDAFKRIPN